MLIDDVNVILPYMSDGKVDNNMYSFLINLSLLLKKLISAPRSDVHSKKSDFRDAFKNKYFSHNNVNR